MNIQRQDWHLRVSITPLCNFRCSYCNPSTQYYRIKEKGVKVGIAVVPTNWICGGPSCKKIRIYTTGRTCEGKNLYGVSYGEKVRTIYEIMQARGNTLVER